MQDNIQLSYKFNLTITISQINNYLQLFFQAEFHSATNWSDNMEKNLEEFKKIYKNISKTYRNSLPLCAAENIMSDFSKLPLTSSLQEKYLLGSAIEYKSNGNFIGSESIFPLYQLLSNQCFELFKSKYAEARTLSGLNAILTILMSLFNSGDKLLITSVECGGHSSLEIFCKRLGLNIEYLDYDYTNYDFDYLKINRKLKHNDIKGVVICLSDMAFVPNIENIELPNDCILIYDATQILGLIAGQIVNNPFDCFKDNQNFILLGATHKTLPGPTCGLIMTRNEKLAKRFDERINPDYLRNIQLHQITSLIFTLSEFAEYGVEYSRAIVNNSNSLGAALEDRGFEIIKKKNLFSNTHQLFISNRRKKILIEKCAEFGVSINIRNKPIYKGEGVRIGVQEITRYGYKDKDMASIAYILELLSVNNSLYDCEIKRQIAKLSNKRNLCYCYSEEIISNLNEFLHNNKF